MEKWGFGYDDVRRVNPEVIYYQSSQLGATGPRRTRSGSGYESGAMAGFTYISGWPDRPPERRAMPRTSATAIAIPTAAEVKL